MSNLQENKKSQNGVLILVFGILSIVVCAPLGIVAWIMGQKEKKLYPGDSNVTAGWILGIIGTCIFILSIIILLICIFIFGIIFSSFFKEIIRTQI